MLDMYCTWGVVYSVICDHLICLHQWWGQRRGR